MLCYLFVQSERGIESRHVVVVWLVEVRVVVQILSEWSELFTEI